jgi:hypothetical protein
MFYVLLYLLILIIILLIIANYQVILYSKKYENFTIPSIGSRNNLNTVKPFSVNKKVSSIIQSKPNDKIKEIEDVQILDDTEKYAYSLTTD